MIGRLRRGLVVRPAWAVLALGVLLAGCAGGTPDAGTTGENQTTGISGTAGPAGPVAVECGLSTFADGHQVIRYCGEGSAKVRSAGAVTRVEGAVCERRGDFLTANYGTNYSNEDAARGHYVGVLLGGLPEHGADQPIKVGHVALDATLDGEHLRAGGVEASVVLDGSNLNGTLTGKGPDGDPLEIAFECPLG